MNLTNFLLLEIKVLPITFLVNKTIIEAILFFDVRCATSIWFLWKLSILASSATLQTMSTEFSFLSCTGILDNSSMKLDLMYCAFSFSFSLTASSSSLTFLIVESSSVFSFFRWLFNFLTSVGSDFCSSNFLIYASFQVLYFRISNSKFLLIPYAFSTFRLFFQCLS